MKKITNIFIFLLVACTAMAQTPMYFNTNVNSGGNTFPLANSGTSRKVQWFIPPGSLGAVPPANNITAVYFQCSGAGSNTYPTLTVKLKTGTGTGLTGTGGGPVEPNMVTVYSANNVAITGVASAWIKITLQTPFLYNPTLPLIVELEHNATTTSGPTICQAVSIPGPGNGRQWADYNWPTITGVGTQQVNFGIDVLPATPCTGTPPSNTVIATANAICPNAVTQVSLATTYTLSNITYSWMASSSSSLGPWSAVPNATNALLSTPQLTTNTWFQLTAFCNGFGSTITAAPAQVSVAPVTTSNVPFYEGFEGISTPNELPNCSWAVSNGNCQTNTQAQTNSRMPRTGNKYASVYGYNLNGTNYYYTNGIYLNPGITYSASLFWMTEYYGYNNFTELSIKYGPNQSPTGLINIATQSVALSPVYKELANTFTVATAGLYYIAIKVVSTSGSFAYYLSWDDLSITIPCQLNSPNVAVTANSSAICLGQSVNLTATGADTYTWNTGATTNTITDSPVTNTTYTAQGTNTLTGCSSTTTKNIVVKPTPAISIVPSATAVCDGSSVNLSVLGASSYTWDNGTNASMITVSPSANTTYTVLGSLPGNNCAGVATQMIMVNPLPNISAQNSPATSCIGQNVNLSASGASTYQWFSNTGYIPGNPVTVSPNVNTTYTVTGTDANGCSKSTTVNQTVLTCVGINERNVGINGLSVYPNPGNGDFTIELVNGARKTIQVMDVTGRLLLTQSSDHDKIHINLNAYANGVYYARVKSNDLTEVIKIVKQ